MSINELDQIGRELEKNRTAAFTAMEALVAGTMTAEQAEIQRKELMQANRAIQARLKALTQK